MGRCHCFALCHMLLLLQLAAGQDLPSITSVYANVSNAVSLSIYWCLLGSSNVWCCMQLHPLQGTSCQRLHQPCVAEKISSPSLDMQDLSAQQEFARNPLKVCHGTPYVARNYSCSTHPWLESYPE